MWQRKAHGFSSFDRGTFVWNSRKRRSWSEIDNACFGIKLKLKFIPHWFSFTTYPKWEQVKLEIMPIRSVLVEYWRPLLLGKVDFVYKLKWLANQMFMFVHESITDTEHNNEWFCLQCCWIHSTSVTVCWNCMLLVFHSYTAEKYTPHYDLSEFGRDWLVYSVVSP